MASGKGPLEAKLEFVTGSAGAAGLREPALCSSLGAAVPLGPPLAPDFYLQPTLAVAKALLGKVLARWSKEGVTAGRIVEVEAYLGARDRAAHSFSLRRTRRNEAMYGPGGSAYVYFIYGMHYCFNVVTGPPQVPEAVLVRAVEPLSGLGVMRKRRGCSPKTPVWKLASGPANLCRALGIDLTLNGAPLWQPPLVLCDAPRVPESQIGSSARIGVGYAGADAQRHWRFFLRHSPAVSGPRSLNGRR